METKSNLLHERVKIAAPLFLAAVGVLLTLQALVEGISSNQLHRGETRCVSEPAHAPTVVSPKRAAKFVTTQTLQSSLNNSYMV